MPNIPSLNDTAAHAASRQPQDSQGSARPGNPGVSAALEALRAATRARHERLDAGMPLSDPQAGLAQYRDHLRLLRAWLAPIERWFKGFRDGPQSALPRSDGMGTGYTYVSRLPLLDADLSHPALPPAERFIALDNTPWPAEAAPAYRWGVCYVIEGSQLGGAVLLQRLGEQLAPHPLGYLRGDGAPGPRWQAYLRALRAEVGAAAEIHAACAGACDAFDRLLKLLQLNEELGALHEATRNGGKVAP